jgi:hypothetical protein
VSLPKLVIINYDMYYLFYIFMKKTENINLLILGSRTDPGFIITLNKTLWSATGASKPMDQKSYKYILL